MKKISPSHIVQAIEIEAYDIASELIARIDVNEISDPLPGEDHLIFKLIASGQKNLILQLIDRMDPSQLAIEKKIKSTEYHERIVTNPLFEARHLPDIALAIARKLPQESLGVQKMLGQSYLIQWGDYLYANPEKAEQSRFVIRELIDRMSDAQLSICAKSEYSNSSSISALTYDLQDEQATLSIIKRMSSPALSGTNLYVLDTNRYPYSRDKVMFQNGGEFLTPIEYYTAIGKTEIVEAIKAKLIQNDLVPVLGNTPASLTARLNYARLEFPDPRVAIEQAMNTNNSAIALNVGFNLLNSCSEFFNEVQLASQRSLSSALAAGEKFNLTAKRVQAVQESLRSLAENPEKLAVEGGVMGYLKNNMRKVFPSLFGQNPYEQDFASPLEDIRKSHQLSISVVEGLNAFQTHYPTIHKDIDELRSALSEAINEIDKRLETETSLAEIKAKTELRGIFSSIQMNAINMAEITEQNLQAVEVMKSTEINFSLSVMTLQVAFAKIATDMAAQISEIKGALAPSEEERMKTLISQQINNVSEFVKIIDARESATSNGVHLEIDVPKAYLQPA